MRAAISGAGDHKEPVDVGRERNEGFVSSQLRSGGSAAA